MYKPGLWLRAASTRPRPAPAIRARGRPGIPDRLAQAPHPAPSLARLQQRRRRQQTTSSSPSIQQDQPPPPAELLPQRPPVAPRVAASRPQSSRLDRRPAISRVRRLPGVAGSQPCIRTNLNKTAVSTLGRAKNGTVTLVWVYSATSGTPYGSGRGPKHAKGRHFARLRGANEVEARPEILRTCSAPTRQCVAQFVS